LMRPLRHVTSINDLTLDEIEAVFSLADRYLAQFGDKEIPYRIGTSGDACNGALMATLFYEPSTRTRLSFESAMLRLGGKAISSADPATSSAAKGESLADTVRMVSNYADILVIRHPRDGAVKLAAQYASVPIINGGDGAHEHPTQTLCDLFTLRRENKTLKNLNVAVSGDLKGSRTIHSFVYALARFGANILLMPAKGMELPAHVDWRLRNEFNVMAVPKEKLGGADPAIDAIYVTAEEPHQLSLYAPDETLTSKLTKDIDVLYMTRFQKERWAEAAHDYPRVDANFLRAGRFEKTSVLHPLPRVGELDVSFDQDSRAAYFRQAAYGVPIRMALIALLLKADAKASLQQFDSGFRRERGHVFEQTRDMGLLCANPNCISHDPLDLQNATPKFTMMPAEPPRLRCFYCESDMQEFVVGDKATNLFCHSGAVTALPEASSDDLVFFASAPDAEKHGFSHATRTSRTAAR
jgi:aspartate carbamoyltransferase catalytic subunit